MSALIVTRTLTPAEFPWLTETIAEGTVVYRFFGRTFGVVGPDGWAVSMVEGEYPFTEVPRDAVRPA